VSKTGPVPNGRAYSADGRVTKRVDQRSIQTAYFYDNIGKLTRKQDDPASPNTVEEYSYDELGRLTMAKLARGGSEQADVRYYYDGLSRATRESQKTKGGTARNVDYAYNKAGVWTALTYPSGKTVNYAYDALSRISTISDGTSERGVYLYVGPSRDSQTTLKNGASTVSTYKLAYDGMARITSALYRNAADDATIIGFEHAYDKVGNPKYEVRKHQSNAGDAYTYDNLYRVTRAIYDDADPTNPTYDVARTEDFLVDPIGNRTKIYAKSATATEYLHDPVNEYTKVGGTGYQYDAAGNLTKDANNYYFWDYENRLTKVKKVSDNSDVAEYVYDALMRRIEKTDYTQNPAVTTRFYMRDWSDIEERDGDDSLTATYVLGPRTDEYLTMVRGGNEYWYMQSPLVGNVAALVNSSGAIQEGYTYSVNGTATVHTGAGNDGIWFTADDTTDTKSALGNPFTYTGRRLDSETGLPYFRFRLYSSLLGAFTSCDPAGYTDGMSLYLGYFALLWNDPFGLGCTGKDILNDLGDDFTASKGVPPMFTGNDPANPDAERLNRENEAMVKGFAITFLTTEVDILLTATTVGDLATLAPLAKDAVKGMAKAAYERALKRGATKAAAELAAKEAAEAEVKLQLEKKAAREAEKRAEKSAADQAARGAAEKGLGEVPGGGGRTVIGKTGDITPDKLGPGENNLLKHLSDQGSPKANWAQNSSVLRTEMAKGVPIRDASVDAAGNLTNDTGFLRAERALLREHGWTYDPKTRLWNAPKCGGCP